jgi:acetolactate synthase-1/2/3 large subunit
MPITKHGYIVKDVNLLADTIRKAFKIAGSGRPGPVLVDITKDVTANKCEYEPVTIDKTREATVIDEEKLDEIAELINASKKPFIYVGGGAVISGAAAQIREFADLVDAPVCDTLMGKGAFDGHDPKYTGMIGMHGTKASNFGVSQCDLLIALGARFSDRVIGNPRTFAGDAKIIHIDIDTAEIGKRLGPTIPLVGDVKDIFNQLVEEDIHIDTREWLGELNHIKHSTVDPRVFSDRFVNPNYLVQELSGRMEEDAIYVADVGQNQLWSADNYVMKNGRFLTTGGMGTMGYSIPAAIGAKMCQPDKQVVAVCGDGAFQMAMNELATARVNDVPIKVVIVRNRVLGLVREYQMNAYKSRYEGIKLFDLPFYDKIAEAYGMEYLHVETNDEVIPNIQKFLAMEEPCLMVVEVADDNNVK